MTDQPTAEAIRLAADVIRAGYPVDYSAASKLVNESIRRQNEAIRAQLEAWGLTWSTTNNFGTTVEGRHVWHTAVAEYADGSSRIMGRWSDNPVECELHIRMYAEGFEAVALEVFEDAGAKVHEAMKRRQKDAEKQVRAIERKQAKVEAKYTDTTTVEQLEATAQEGMLF